MVTQANFSSAFRQAFSFLEERGEHPSFPKIFTSFCEDIPVCGWELGCGYRSHYVHFYAKWDVRDRWFGMYLEPMLKASRVRFPWEVVVDLDQVLGALNPEWRHNPVRVDTENWVSRVSEYSLGVRPVAKALFFPDRRPSVGFEGFAWYEALASAGTADP